MIPTTGPVSMTQICTEAGIAKSNASLNNSTLRALATKPTPSSMIRFSDFRGKSKSSGTTPTPTPVDPNIEYMLIQYIKSGTTDLDTVTGLFNQLTGTEYIGAGFKLNNTAGYASYGGDAGIGSTSPESVLINLTRLKGTRFFGSVWVDCRARWYGTPSTSPVGLKITIWKGGTPTKSGLTWVNPTATSTSTTSYAGKVITLKTSDPKSIGVRVAYITINPDTNGLSFLA